MTLWKLYKLFICCCWNGHDEPLQYWRVFLFEENKKFLRFRGVLNTSTKINHFGHPPSLIRDENGCPSRIYCVKEFLAHVQTREWSMGGTLGQDLASYSASQQPQAAAAIRRASRTKLARGLASPACANLPFLVWGGPGGHSLAKGFFFQIYLSPCQRFPYWANDSSGPGPPPQRCFQNANG